MAYEATPVELTGGTGFPRRFTVGSNLAVTKGAVMQFTDPRTASMANTTGQNFAGIARMDKDSTDASTDITVWTDGVFEMYASGAIAAGNWVQTEADNFVRVVTPTASGAIILGYALETATTGELINVRVMA